MKPIAQAALCLWVLLSASACQPGASSQDIQTIKQQQEQILAELRELKDVSRRVLATAAAGQRPSRPPEEDYSRVYSLSIGESPVRGDAKAPVTLVEFSDFQCPYCAQAQGDLKALLDKYPGKLKLVFKHFPLSFHQQARPAALASLAAQDQGKFWQMHDVLFNNQKALDAAKLEEYARQAGLDVERFKKDMERNREAYEKQIQADMLLGQNADVRGTPSLYIAGKKVRQRSLDAMSAMVEEALKAPAAAKQG
jgi:protein-disulfide isomerase